MPVAELFRALGDPTRLEMVRRLTSGDPYTIKSLSSGLDISRQGARKHIQVLIDAELVSLQPQGREALVYIDRRVLEQGKAYIANLERAWDARLEALRQFVDED